MSEKKIMWEGKPGGDYYNKVVAEWEGNILRIGCPDDEGKIESGIGIEKNRDGTVNVYCYYEGVYDSTENVPLKILPDFPNEDR